MLAAVVILYVIGVVLAVWSASLMWRVLQSRLRLVPAGTTLTRRRRVLGVWAAVLSAVLGAGALVAGEWVRAGFSRPGDGAFFHWAGIAVCVALAASSLWAGWRFDSARGRRRCARCWYDMGGIATLRCPECGRQGASEAGLRRTRRSWRMMALSPVFLAGAYCLYAAPLVRESGWRATIPTTALILALPWLPEELVSGEEGSLNQREDIPGWQEDFLRWRCARLIRRCKDREVLLRAMNLYEAPANQDAEPRISSAVLSDLLADYCSNDQSRVEGASRLLHSESAFVPETLDEAFSTRLVPVIAAALVDPSAETAPRAAACVPRLGQHAEQFVPALKELIDRFPPGPPPADPRGFSAIYSILEMAPRGGAAWEAYLSLFEHDSEWVRWFACRYARNFPDRADLLIPRLFASLDSASDIAAGGAATSLLTISPEPRAFVPQVLNIAEQRTGVASRVILSLASTSPEEPRILMLVERMLGSDDADAQRAAAMASESLGAGGAKLIPTLRTLVTQRAMNPDVADAAQSAIKEIERAVDESHP